MNTLFVIVLLCVIVWIVISYNGYIQLINRANEAWSDIDVALKRRFDLIPNVIAAIKVYAKHEKTVFEDVATARTQAMQATSVHDKDLKNAAVKESLGKLLAVAEGYPELRASDNFIQLQRDLTDTENIIASARKYYNGTVRNLNIKIHSFPDLLIAKGAGFKPREFFEADEEERAGVAVNI